jgi:hypothetical protein
LGIEQNQELLPRRKRLGITVSLELTHDPRKNMSGNEIEKLIEDGILMSHGLKPPDLLSFLKPISTGGSSSRLPQIHFPRTEVNCNQKCNRAKLTVAHLSQHRRGIEGKNACPSASNQCTMSQVSYGTRCLFNPRSQFLIRVKDLQPDREQEDVFSEWERRCVWPSCFEG